MPTKTSPSSAKRERRGVHQASRQAQADILLLDLRMPIRRLAVLEESISIRCLRGRRFDRAEDDRDVVRAMRLGARGVVLKQSATISVKASTACCRRNLARQSHDAEVMKAFSKSANPGHAAKSRAQRP